MAASASFISSTLSALLGALARCSSASAIMCLLAQMCTERIPVVDLSPFIYRPQNDVGSNLMTEVWGHSSHLLRDTDVLMSIGVNLTNNRRRFRSDLRSIDRCHV